MKIYTEKQVSVATFLASPMAGGILMAHNAKVVGQKKEARWFLGITAVATIAVILLGIFVLPERKSGNYLVPLLLALAMKYWCQKTQGDFITSGRFPEAKRASWWTTIGISLLVIVVILALFFGSVFVFSIGA